MPKRSLRQVFFQTGRWLAFLGPYRTVAAKGKKRAPIKMARRSIKRQLSLKRASKISIATLNLRWRDLRSPGYDKTGLQLRTIDWSNLLRLRRASLP